MDVKAACEEIEERGYCVLEGLMKADQADRFDRRSRQLMRDASGYAKYEGALNAMPELVSMCAHPSFFAQELIKRSQI